MPTSPKQPLLCHPSGHCSVIQALTVSAKLAANGALHLSYHLSGEIADLLLPARLAPAAADNLWQHTCCEAFIGATNNPEYYEFNFSPSEQWAAYRFTDYRQRDNRFQLAATPQITQQRRANAFSLAAILPPGLLPTGESLQVGLSAVIETREGSKSYWALAHCAAQPDFHLRQSFALTLKQNTP